ncbi:SUMF1/EgtB/PvdO family nonheme iron enzyme [Luteolibacter ambystomatis]|uniref:SUMF1/EgtB/PvdO family nonheme iron enzyme n=1 Tax=Luteolibacter ambystomatis TaxID=2824561 RepID=A0A975G6W0_9BACT|nr:SUMF1/EgtB/PvdO family nonheme iron enzyme [Luteolibacter ambystomatis]QUE50184.1 SUMF1/EgtB/PvdO family nonheme iron enzyme [Luteolibacter ambystomatis]
MKTASITSLVARAAACSALSLLTHCANTPASAASGGGTPGVATVSAPLVNSLGMKFVPIPGTKVLMCATETSVAQYKAAGRGYNAPWYPQGEHHAAANITWADAKAWCDWMSAKEGRKYRLPTSAEWSAAAGGSGFPWGTSWPPSSGAGNYCGQEWRTAPEKDLQQLKDLWKSRYGQTKGLITGYQDGYLYTAPVESQTPNALGLRHMSGNVWEWCESKVLRGGSWADNDQRFLTLNATVSSPLYDFDNGFRCVIEN